MERWILVALVIVAIVFGCASVACRGERGPVCDVVRYFTDVEDPFGESY